MLNLHRERTTSVTQEYSRILDKATLQNGALLTVVNHQSYMSTKEKKGDKN